MRIIQGFSIESDVVFKFQEAVPRGQRSQIIQQLMEAYAENGTKPDQELNTTEMLSRLEHYKTELAKNKVQMQDLQDRLDKKAEPRQDTLYI